MGWGSQPPGGHPGSTDAGFFEPYGVDPSIAPGLARPEGWRVGLPDGSAAWDKTGPLDTNWSPVSAPAAAGVQTVTGNPAALVDNTDPANPVVQPSFGEDTTLEKANAAAVLKKILQLIAAYTSNVAGAEASSWTIRVLQAGAQIAGQVITGVGTLFPDGVFTGTPSASRASVAIGVVGTGIRRFVGLNALAFMVSGREIAYIGDDTANNTAHLRLNGTFARMLLGDDVEFKRTVDATSSQSAGQLSASFNGAPTDIAIGVPGVLANNATGGFLEIGYCPGIPTGIPLEIAGKRALCIGFDAEGDAQWHLYGHIGSGTWVPL